MPIGDSRKQLVRFHRPLQLSGLTLPVWVAAAAKAALQVLLGEPFEPEQQLESGVRSTLDAGPCLLGCARSGTR